MVAADLHSVFSIVVSPLPLKEINMKKAIKDQIHVCTSEPTPLLAPGMVAQQEVGFGVPDFLTGIVAK